jgi:hypothetical protein
MVAPWKRRDVRRRVDELAGEIETGTVAGYSLHD